MPDQVRYDARMTFYEFVQFKIAERSDILNSTFDVGRSMFGVQIGIFLKSTALGFIPARFDNSESADGLKDEILKQKVKQCHPSI